ncbi:class II aldolase/adducin family protein [Candidatus Pelagibacter sp.]|nr:class II aldolase/adducin family protein [Candidatus Pelagibacter sp.]
MKNLKERQEVIDYSIKLNITNLSPLRSGNISVRGIERGIEGFFITPSGKKYETLKPEDIVFLSLNEKKDFLSWFNSGKNPSSEWRFHQDIYKNKWEAKAIVHAHSTHATAVSTHGKSIPPFHYMIALAGGEDIRCSEYATFGTHELSMNIIKALKDRKACLMSNHGQVAYGVNLSKAFELAQEIENICHQYIIALKMGEPKNLSLSEMNKILDKVKNYKSE